MKPQCKPHTHKKKEEGLSEAKPKEVCPCKELERGHLIEKSRAQSTRMGSYLKVFIFFNSSSEVSSV
jgi:hypothetical protein